MQITVATDKQILFFLTQPSKYISLGNLQSNEQAFCLKKEMFELYIESNKPENAISDEKKMNYQDKNKKENGYCFHN